MNDKLKDTNLNDGVNDGEGSNGGEEKKFTQAELENVLKKRVADIVNA